MYKCITSKHYRKRNGFVVGKIFKQTLQSQYFIHTDTHPEYEDLNK